MAHLQQTSTRNKLLASMSPEDFAILQPDLEPVELEVRKVLIEPNKRIDYAYFPEAGVSSIINNSHDGKIEVGIIGREGFVGIPVVLGTDRNPFEYFIQIPGHGLRISTEALNRAIDQSRSLHRHFLRYAQAKSVQASETAFANANNNVESRLARWILMCHDRVDGDEIQLTHEFMAMMLGVRRPGVTTALHVLGGNGLIWAKRSLVTVRDREKLEELADDAYGVSHAEYERLMNGGT